jgi:hypothetical protein
MLISAVCPGLAMGFPSPKSRNLIVQLACYMRSGVMAKIVLPRSGFAA